MYVEITNRATVNLCGNMGIVWGMLDGIYSM